MVRAKIKLCSGCKIMNLANLSLPMQESVNEKNRIFSVSEINFQAKQMLENQFGAVSVVGEISNLKNVSGNYYLTLKDSASQLSAVLFRRQATELKFRLEHGLEIVASGKLTVYPPYGRYQLMIERVEPKGLGNLQLAFEQLKNKLEQEGLFAKERKKALPLLPRRVAVITSPTGAVIRDIIHVATRRFPGAQILVVPCRVQGDAAVDEIISALVRANECAMTAGVNVAILARGGGSLEDLWCFNDEKLARIIAESKIPVVSAVGHETDYTIADFVADYRAPTPSAAAEVVFPDSKELISFMAEHERRLAAFMRRQITDEQMRLEHCRLKLFRETDRIGENHQRLAFTVLKLERQIQSFIHHKQSNIEYYYKRFLELHPAVKIREYLLHIKHHSLRQRQAILTQIAEQRRSLEHSTQKMDALSPLNILSRGYSIVQNEAGEVIRSCHKVEVDEELDIRLYDGLLKTQVRQIADD